MSAAGCGVRREAVEIKGEKPPIRSWNKHKSGRS
jgi:hypothetical protein